MSAGVSCANGHQRSFNPQFETWLENTLRDKGVVGSREQKIVTPTVVAKSVHSTTRDSATRSGGFDTNNLGNNTSSYLTGSFPEGESTCVGLFSVSPHGAAGNSDTTSGAVHLSASSLSELVSTAFKMSGTTRHGSSGGGDYYKMVWNEDDETATQDAVKQTSTLQSAKERVAQILLETELGYSDVLNYDPSKALEFQEPALDIKGGLAFYDDDDDALRRTPAGDDDLFASWDMPTVHGNVGYGRGRGDGASEATSPADEHQLPANVFQVTFRKSTEDLDKLRVDSKRSISPKAKNFHDSRQQQQQQQQQKNYQMSSSGEGHEVPVKRRSPMQAVLPMDDLNDLEMEMETESEDDEGMLDLDLHRPEVTGDLDTAPIITVDQAQLSHKFLQRRRKLKIALCVTIVILAIGAFATIVYLVVHFLSAA